MRLETLTLEKFGIESSEKEKVQRRLLIIGHTYQPPREFLNLSSLDNQKRVDIISSVNEKVYNECYKPNLVDKEKLPDGFMFSFYGTLREWIKGHHPEGFELIKEHINNIYNKEYQIMGDTYLHPIMPLLSEKNQDLLLKIGKKAFEKDFGFTPKGIWLPETAVSSSVLRNCFKNGYEFAILRDNQLNNSEKNPMYVPIIENEQKIGEMAVIHIDSELSGSVSFVNETTVNTEKFLKNPWFNNKKDYIIGTDTEFYGHHIKFKDKFLNYITKPEVLNENGFTVFEVYKALTDPEKEYTQIQENSSWSCMHNLGRWKGTCYCDTHNEQIVQEIKDLYQTTKKYGVELDKRLDDIDENWREKFIEFFLATRKTVFYDGDLDLDINDLIEEKGLDILKNKETVNLFKTQLARFIGETSCFGFFRDTLNRPEREIASVNIKAIKTLIPDIDRI